MFWHPYWQMPGVHPPITCLLPATADRETQSHRHFILQSNPAISNSVNSKSPLFRRTIEFPWIYPYVFSHLLSAISNSVIRIPRYFELIVLSLHLKSTPLFRTCQKQEYVHKSTAGNVLHFIWARTEHSKIFQCNSVCWFIRLKPAGRSRSFIHCRPYACSNCK